MFIRHWSFRPPPWTVPILLWLMTRSVYGQSDQIVYTDSLQNGWQNWSWATVNLAAGSPVHGGSSAISVSATNWSALYLYHPVQNGSSFANLNLWINGGNAGGQLVQVQATRSGVAQSAVALAALPANSWRAESVPLAALGVESAADFDGFWLQVQNAGPVPIFYVDDITLTAATAPPPPDPGSSIAITVDAALNRHPISPLIYGVAFATAGQLHELNSPLNRSGGNSETRYNWQLNAHNHANDWYFESLADASATPGAAADDHVAASKSGGADAILTVPMIGWAPKLGTNRGRLSSYSIAKYGPQTDSDSQWFSDAGNGVRASDGSEITSNDPNDANVPVDSTFEQDWIRHLTNTWGSATNGGVRYYCLDNEHGLWNSTHRDIHPVGTTMQEIRDKIFDYGARVKEVDPNAILLGPEEWGWPGYLYSGYDWQWAGDHGNWNPTGFPDRTANGGMDYGPWLLNQMRHYELTNGVRLLDVYTLHDYPQGNGKGTYEYGNDTSIAAQLLRNRSTRQLWDTNYLDPSWIASVIKLIPRMRDWVAAYYPGTKIGITEYNWGAEGHINGATAQADIFGIFGREGLDLATRWTTPDAGTPTFNAMKMYRNYDGNLSTFGDTSVSAAGPNPDLVSCFAAVRSSDKALTIMAINKQPGTNAPATFAMNNYLPSGAAQVWQLNSSNIISRLADIHFAGGTFSNTLPAQSITLFVIPAGTPPDLHALDASGGIFHFQLIGQAGQRYVLSSSPDCARWMPVQTNILDAATASISFPATGNQQFYRAGWLP